MEPNASSSAGQHEPADQTPETETAKPENSPKPTGKPVNYESNPFQVTISGLITLLKVNPMSSLLLAIVLVLVFVGVLFVSIFLAIIPFVGPLLMLAIMLVSFPVVIGAYHALAVSSIQGNTRSTSDFIGDAFKKTLPLLGASILIGLAVFVGFLFLIIPGIILGCWFSLTFFVIFDENLGAIASMKRSKELVSGHILEIIGASIAGGLMSGTSAGGGGGLLSPAITVAPMAGRYQQLKALKASGQPKPKIHWLNYTILIVGGLAMLVIIAAYSIAAIAGFNDAKNGRSGFGDTYQSSEEKQLEQQLRDLDKKYDLDNEQSPYPSRSSQ